MSLWPKSVILFNTEKVQAEIEREIGQSRQPTMEDRANLPYTDAVIHEVQRMGNIVPLSLPHATSKEMQLGGYTIPKVIFQTDSVKDKALHYKPLCVFIHHDFIHQGVMVIPNLASALFDKNEWEKPFTFNPGNFLNEEGKFVKRAAFIPFSAGEEHHNQTLCIFTSLFTELS